MKKQLLFFLKMIWKTKSILILSAKSLLICQQRKRFAGFGERYILIRARFYLQSVQR